MNEGHPDLFRFGPIKARYIKATSKAVKYKVNQFDRSPNGSRLKRLLSQLSAIKPISSNANLSQISQRKPLALDPEQFGSLLN